MSIQIKEMPFSCYPVADLARARKFYEEVLGLKTTQEYVGEEGAWIEYDIGSSTLALGYGMKEWQPSAHGGAVALEVQDYETAMRKLRDAGAQVMHEERDLPTCDMAIIQDSEGNSLIIHKRKQ